MITQIKLALALMISIGLLGALWYVQHLRSENEILTLNNANYENTVIAWQKYAADKKADADLKTQQVRKRMNQISQLNQRAAELTQQLKRTITDEKVTECLGARPGPDYVNQLRKYTQGVDFSGAGKGVPGTEPVREPDPGRVD